MKVEVPCFNCGGQYIHFQPARGSVRWVQGVCWKCGRRGIAGITEEDAIEQWNKSNDPKAFVKTLAAADESV